MKLWARKNAIITVSQAINNNKIMVRNLVTNDRTLLVIEAAIKMDRINAVRDRKLINNTER